MVLYPGCFDVVCLNLDCFVCIAGMSQWGRSVKMFLQLAALEVNGHKGEQSKHTLGGKFHVRMNAMFRSCGRWSCMHAHG